MLEIKDPIIKLIQNPFNVGFEDNWNNALNQARLPYFKLMPQDDLLERLCLETQINSFENVKEPIALVCCARNIINSKGKKLLERGMKGATTGFLTAGSAIKKIVRSGSNPIGEPGAVLMKLETARAIGKFSKGKIYTIDLDYWMRALQFGGLYYIDQPLASFRVHQGSLTLLKSHRRPSKASSQSNANCLQPISAKRRSQTRRRLKNYLISNIWRARLMARVRRR